MSSARAKQPLMLTRRGLLTGALTSGAGLLLGGRGVRQRVARAESQITITTPLAWLRNGPGLLDGNTIPVRKGEFYGVTGRSADKRWLRLAVPAAASRGTWLYAALAAFPGDAGASNAIDGIPVVNMAGRPAAKPPRKPAPFPAWIPRVTPSQRAIYQRASNAGKLTDMFTVIGDCNSQPPVYLGRVATGEFDLSRVQPRLQAAALRFSDAFGRVSLAAKGGFGTANMLDPIWADGALCGTQQGPFECEVWVSRASIVFIELGTGDQLAWRDFEKNYRPLVELTLKKGALPVLVTKADDIETSTGAKPGHINAVIRATAAAYQVPLYDFYAASRELPNTGLIDEGDKDFHLNDAGIQRHIEGTLQTLAAVSV